MLFLWELPHGALPLLPDTRSHPQITATASGLSPWCVPMQGRCLQDSCPYQWLTDVNTPQNCCATGHQLSPQESPSLSFPLGPLLLLSVYTWILPLGLAPPQIASSARYLSRCDFFLFLFLVSRMKACGTWANRLPGTRMSSLAGTLGLHSFGRRNWNYQHQQRLGSRGHHNSCFACIFQFNVTTTLWSKCYYLHYANYETEAQRA